MLVHAFWPAQHLYFAPKPKPITTDISYWLCSIYQVRRKYSHPSVAQPSTPTKIIYPFNTTPHHMTKPRANARPHTTILQSPSLAWNKRRCRQLQRPRHSALYQYGRIRHRTMYLDNFLSSGRALWSIARTTSLPLPSRQWHHAVIHKSSLWLLNQMIGTGQ